MTDEDKKEKDPWNITIPETEGKHEVEGPKVVNSDISEPLKIRQVNIKSEEEPKFAKIGDYGTKT